MKHFNVVFHNLKKKQEKINDFLENIDFGLKRIFCDFLNGGYARSRASNIYTFFAF